MASPLTQLLERAAEIRRSGGGIGTAGGQPGARVPDTLDLLASRLGVREVGLDTSSYNQGGVRVAVPGPTGAVEWTPVLPISVLPIYQPPSPLPFDPPPPVVNPPPPSLPEPRLPPPTGLPPVYPPPTSNPMSSNPLINPLTSPGATPNPFALGDQTVDPTGALTGLANQGCSAIGNASLRALCLAGVSIGGAIINSRGTGPGTGTPVQCPEGYKPDQQGRCIKQGVGGMLERALPGGATGVAWTPTLGLYGAGVTPVGVASQRRVCPTGFKLGKDGICYEQLARTQRAWNPGARPLLTGGDVNALRRAKQLKKKIGKMARTYDPKPRCSSSSTRRKGK